MDAQETPPISEGEKLENNKKLPATGFHTNPERINRNGRPKKDWTWATLLEEAAEELVDIKGKDKDGNIVITGRKALKKLVAKKLLTMAAGGNVQAANVLMNRTDGMPAQPVDHTGEININLSEMLDKVYGEPEDTNENK